jgi:acid-sensing ion channel, other
LPHEKKLKYFKVYTQINCEHECLANLTVESCGCAQFFTVRDSSTRICGVIDEKCFRKVEGEFENNKDHCNCIETCETLKYDVESNKDAIIL